jgi:hypothetical protein
MYDLKNFRYGHIEREQMEAMIEAFLTGRSYEAEKEVAANTAVSTGSPSLDTSLNTAKPVQDAAAVVQQVTESVAPAAAPASTGKLSPQEILRKLKERQNGAA